MSAPAPFIVIHPRSVWKGLSLKPGCSFPHRLPSQIDRKRAPTGLQQSFEYAVIARRALTSLFTFATQPAPLSSKRYSTSLPPATRKEPLAQTTAAPLACSPREKTTKARHDSCSNVLPIVPTETGHKSGHRAHYSGTTPAIECLPEHKVHWNRRETIWTTYTTPRRKLR